MKSFIQPLVIIIISLAIVSCGSDNPYKQTKKTKSTKTEKTVTKTATVEAKVASGVSADQLKKAESLLSATSKDDINSIDAKKIFKMHCSLCHGFKGDMMVNGAKDLTSSKISRKEAIAQIYHGKGLMTPYKGILTDAEIIAVSNYTITLRK